jgi:hypothetical protein
VRLSGNLKQSHGFNGPLIVREVREAIKTAMREDACQFAHMYGSLAPALTGNLRQQINEAISRAGGHGDLSTERTGRGSSAGPVGDPDKQYQRPFSAYGVPVTSRPAWADVEAVHRPDDGEVWLDINFRGGGSWVKADFTFAVDVPYWERWEDTYNLFDTVIEAFDPVSTRYWGKVGSAIAKWVDETLLTEEKARQAKAFKPITVPGYKYTSED